jgi:pimeloyl-ACP methyl ester carboxylesterase
MLAFDALGAEFRYAARGAPLAAAAAQVIWAHGWGQDHRVFLPLAEQIERAGSHLLLDFPGFGASPPPPAAWGTEDYADAVAAWLATLPRAPRLWVGHSFGCRIGLRLAARHPQSVDGLTLVAAAGLRRRRTLAQRLQLGAKVAAYKTLKQLGRMRFPVERWRSRFGSSDYRSAGAMRPILVKVVQEDLSDVARHVRCPTLLIYGSRDTETPPEIGRRFERLIPEARLVLVEGFDHYSILGEGRHQVLHQLNQFLRNLGR